MKMMVGLLCLALMAIGQAHATEVSSAAWPTGKDPSAVGRRLVERFLSRTPDEWNAHHSQWAVGKQIAYPTACVWDGALRFAKAVGDTNLLNRIAAVYEPFYGKDAHLIPPSTHVDFTMFGGIPLSVYAVTGDRRALETGLAMADAQWAEPKPGAEAINGMADFAGQRAYWKDGYTPQTRLWIDDMFMISFVQLAAYRTTGKRHYADRVAKEMVLYLDRLQNPDGLFYHAPDVPFAWGRGNGWMAVGMTRVLESLPVDHPHRERILSGYRKMMATLLKHQRKGGLWGQLVDDPTSWPETSGSGMFAYAFIEGARMGLLDAEYGAAGRRAYLALVDYLTAQGEVREVCVGTNKLNDRDYYLARPRCTGDHHGQAPLLWCCAALTAAPSVRSLFAALPQDGGAIRLARGTYHFCENDALPMVLFPSNNGGGEKRVVFPLVNRRNITIDGGGSTFVFHGQTFPFAATNCSGLTFRNFTVTTHYPPCAGFVVTEKSDAGFTARFDEGVCPYAIQDGHLIFRLDGHEVSTHGGRLSLHAIDRFLVTYLMTPTAPGDKSEFPANFVGVVPQDIGNRTVRFTYYGDKHAKSVKCPYNVGEKVVVNLEEKRSRDVFFFEDCDHVTVENVTVRRFGGMGVIAQRSGNIRVSHLVAEPPEGERITLTADIVQFINCYGDCAIRNCTGGHSLDDWINVHGNYLEVVSVNGRKAGLRTRHGAHAGFFPYRVGDMVEFLTARGREVVATARVASVTPDATDLTNCTLGFDTDLPTAVVAGLLVENATLNPNVTISGNRFVDYPNLRLSGRGRYLIADNVFEKGLTAVTGMDLAEYWYESGRIRDMTIRNNVLRDCGGFHFGLLGWSGADAPKIHDTVRLEGNVFESVRGRKWSVIGVRNFYVDGKSRRSER